MFTRTKHGADKVVRGLNKSGIPADAIHGNKSQNQRERVLAGLPRPARSRTLVATDIAARGIDVDGISHVINFDLPNIPESYVHRIGRTARAGADGIAISLCSRDELAVPARHREADPDVDPGDRRAAPRAAQHQARPQQHRQGQRQRQRPGQRQDGRNGRGRNDDGAAAAGAITVAARAAIMVTMPATGAAAISRPHRSNGEIADRGLHAAQGGRAAAGGPASAPIQPR